MGVPALSISYIPPPPGESVTPADQRRLGATNSCHRKKPLSVSSQGIVGEGQSAGGNPRVGPFSKKRWFPSASLDLLGVPAPRADSAGEVEASASDLAALSGGPLASSICPTPRLCSTW